MGKHSAPAASAVSILDHINMRLAEMDLRYQQRHDAASKAVEAALFATREAVGKAEFANTRRFESVNEFRQTLSDQATTFMQRNEAEARWAAMDAKIDSLKETIDRTVIGRASGADAFRGILGWVVGMVLTVISIAGAIIGTR